jgi:hypothetical protein
MRSEGRVVLADEYKVLIGSNGVRKRETLSCVMIPYMASELRGYSTGGMTPTDENRYTQREIRPTATSSTTNPIW